MARSKNRGSQGGGNQMNGSNGRRTDLPCSYCNRTGHESAKCYQYRCNRNGCPGRVGVHDPQNCPLVKGTAANSAYTNQQKVCTYCGKFGHEFDTCRARDKKTIDVTMTSPIATSQPYCEYCNMKAHTTRAYPNDGAMVEWHKSKLRCMRCRVRGHTSDSCKNPARKDCDFCLAPGHERAHCPLRQNKSKQECKTPATAIRQTFRRDSRVEPSQFIVTHDQFLHLSQVKRRQLKDEQFKYKQAILTMSENDRLAATLALEDLERDTLDLERGIFKLKSPVPANRRRLQDISGPIATSSTRNASQAGRFAKATSLATSHGHDAAWTEQAIRDKELKDMDEAEIKIIGKINKSRFLYSAEEYGKKITLYENTIFHRNLLPRARLDQIKYHLIWPGHKIYRDPAAIAALFGRKIPICTLCGHQGAIVDNRFEIIDPMAPADIIYDLDDSTFNDWGLFIVFQCPTHSTKSTYRFDKMPKSIIKDTDMTDALHKPYGDLAWEV